MRVENLIADLDQPPHWLRGFATFAAERHCVARARAVISGLGRLLHADPVAHPQQLLDRVRRPGRSMGTLARTLEQFFTDHGLAPPTDQVDRLAAGRRQRRIDAVPESLRPAVQGFAGAMLASRDRARRAGTRPRSDHTIEQHLASVRNVAIFLVQQRHITDWASVGVGDVEAFLAEHPKFRKSLLTGLRQFFRIARQRRLILVDPTAGIVAREPRGFRGSTLAPSEQRRLFRRWTSSTDAHPHEAFVGLLALLHGASVNELRHLTIDDINRCEHTVHLGQRPHPVPLDPASWTALQHCLDHREALRTVNPHVLVTKVTRTGQLPASAYFFSHLLDHAGVRLKGLRSARLVDLVNNLDPKLVAAAFGMTAEGVLTYFADRIDPTLEATLDETM